MKNIHKIISSTLMIFSALLALYILLSPEGFLAKLDNVPMKFIAVLTLIFLSTLLSFVILWYYYEPKPTRLIAGTCRLLTTSFVLSLASVLSFIPSIDNARLSTSSIFIEFTEPSKDIIILCVAIMFTLVFSSATYAVVYFYNTQRN